MANLSIEKGVSRDEVGMKWGWSRSFVGEGKLFLKGIGVVLHLLKVLQEMAGIVGDKFRTDAAVITPLLNTRLIAQNPYRHALLCLPQIISSSLLIHKGLSIIT